MSVPIAVPKVGWGTEPLELVEWKAAEGSLIHRDNPVLVITTKKIESDIHAETAGYLHIVVPEGNKAPIGSIVGFIAASQEELQTLQKEKPTEPSTTASEPDRPVKNESENTTPSAPADRSRIRISPAARRMAEEHSVDISNIVGTGPGGMINREDIQKSIDRKVQAPPPATTEKRIKSKIPLRGMRAAIAENMYQSLSTSAQLTVMGEIEMTEIVKLRDALVKQVDAFGVNITYTDILVFMIARILHNYPVINSSIIENEIILWEDINIGVAVALEDGLIVPVVSHADKKSLIEISRNIKELASRAKEKRLTPDHVTGGTFTITNLGARGGGYRFETVIINPRESAIFGTGGITDRVVARDGQIVIRPVMTYYFTYDHRVIDGALAADFINSLTRLLENPYLSLDWKKIV